MRPLLTLFLCCLIILFRFPIFPVWAHLQSPYETTWMIPGNVLHMKKKKKKRRCPLRPSPNGVMFLPSSWERFHYPEIQHKGVLVCIKYTFHLPIHWAGCLFTFFPKVFHYMERRIALHLIAENCVSWPIKNFASQTSSIRINASIFQNMVKISCLLALYACICEAAQHSAFS